MNLEKFNKNLNELGEAIREIKTCKGQLKRYTSSQVLMYLVSLDKEGRGYLTKNHISQLFSKDQRALLQKSDFIDQIFPDQKISYTYFISYLTRDATKNIMINELRREDLQLLIKTILIKEQCILSKKPLIFQYIHKFIPMSSESLTLDELTQYSLSQNLKIDPTEVMNHISMDRKFIKIKKQEEESQRTDPNEVINRLKSITQRLSLRVQNFGKEWLTTHEN